MGNGVPSTEQEARKFALRANNPGDHGLCTERESVAEKSKRVLRSKFIFLSQISLGDSCP
jgi:hypothetical protein